MATAAVLDWDFRFAELARANPPNVRAVWALIVECMDDDSELSHTFNGALKARGVPQREELRQDLALRLTRMIWAHPRLNLEHRPPEVSTAAWLYGVVLHLAAKTVDAAAAVQRRHRLARESLNRYLMATRNGSSSVLGQVDPWRAETIDAAVDVAEALAACDPQTVEVLVAYSTDAHVETVARQLDLPHATAWRRVRDAKQTLRLQLSGYGG